jgi:hypothetical protein
VLQPLLPTLIRFAAQALKRRGSLLRPGGLRSFIQGGSAAAAGGQFAMVYLSLATVSRHKWTHAIAYGAGALLAITLAACAATLH